MSTTTAEADFLSEDPELRGQKFVCLSFLSPEDVIVRKDAHAFSKFLGSFAKELGELFDSLNQRFEGDAPVVDMLQNVRSRYDYVFDEEALDKQFQFWRANEGSESDRAYDEANGFRTSVRGIKVRGTYDTFAEAENRCKQIKRFDPLFDVYVAQVGCWCPWSPRPELLQNQEFANEQLNTMMKQYVESQNAKDQVYQKRVEELVDKARGSGSNIDVSQLAEQLAASGGPGGDPWLKRKQDVEEQTQE